MVTPDTSVEPTPPPQLFPTCGTGSWHHIANFTLGTDTTGAWGNMQHWGQTPDGWNWWVALAPGHAKPVKVFGRVYYLVTKYLLVKATTGQFNQFSYSFWYSCTEYSSTSEGANVASQAQSSKYSLSGVPEWVEAPTGAGPSGLGETPKLDGGVWWVKQGDTVLRCDGVAAPQTPGIGDLPNAQQAAGALMAWFSSHAPSRDVIPQVSAFQSAYNGSGLSGSLTVDGQYGPNTQAALQAVLNQNSPPQAAPQNVFSTVIPAAPAPDQAPTTIPTATTPTPATPKPTTDTMPLVVIGGATLAGLALVAYAWHRKKKRR